MTDRERYTAEELARLSDAEMVRRELDRSNRQWLVVLLIAFAVMSVAGLVVDAFDGPVPRVLMLTVAANVILNLIALGALRLARRNLTGWVLLFCVVQFLFAITQPNRWSLGVIFALLFARFRLPASATVGLFAFMSGAVAVAAQFDPLSSVSAHFTDAQITRVGVLVNVFLILAAAALQLVSTRRVRAEILDEWSEPLRNAREQVRMRDELQYARQMQLAMLPEAPPRLAWLDTGTETAAMSSHSSRGGAFADARRTTT